MLGRICFFILVHSLAQGTFHCVAQTSDPVVERSLFLLKTYSFASERQQKITDEHLAKAYLPALKELGLGPIGVFRQLDQDTVIKTVILIPFGNLAEFASLEDSLIASNIYLSKGLRYLNAAHDSAPYNRISSVLMRAFTGMPELATPTLGSDRSKRIYELRSYEGATESLYQKKVDMFNAGGEIELFARLNFNAIFYAEVLAGPHMPNLMYMTAFADMESRDAHWDTFRKDSEWLELKAKDMYQNTVSHADIYFLVPTAYSDY